MFQEFFTDTLASRYIKTLLQETYIPVFDSVVDGDYLVAKCYYTYQNYIIKCTKSGRLITGNQTTIPSNDIAEFDIKSLIDIHDPKIMSTYRSTSNYYDSDTHKQLGRYLRYIHSSTGLNLLPFYNCYNQKSIPDIELAYVNSGESISKLRGVRDNDLNTVGINIVTKQTKKIVAIPIIFGRTYTIATNCSEEVLMRAIIYDRELNNVETSKLSSSWKIFSNLQFSSPVNFSVELTRETSDPQLIQQQRNLYLIIQLPVEHSSSIVVLENFNSKQGIFCNENNVRQFDFISSSLLYMSSSKSFAFSNRLIEYLLNNVISAQDVISNNIKKIQKALIQITPLDTNVYRHLMNNNRVYEGIWDSNINQEILKLAHEYSKNHFILDQDGNINKDVEQLILKKGIDY